MSSALDPTITDMEGEAALPRDNGELVFAAPWEGRSLAMAVALVDAMGLEWEDFRDRLVAEVAAEPDRPYYESWAAALEGLVISRGLTDAEDLRRRAHAVVPPA